MVAYENGFQERDRQSIATRRAPSVFMWPDGPKLTGPRPLAFKVRVRLDAWLGLSVMREYVQHRFEAEDVAISAQTEDDTICDWRQDALNPACFDVG